MNKLLVALCSAAVLLLSVQVQGLEHRGQQGSSFVTGSWSKGEDEFELPSSILFEVSSLALQLGKMVQWLTPGMEYLGINYEFGWDYNRTLCNDEECTLFHEQISIGGDDDGYAVTLWGGQSTHSSVKFYPTSFEYNIRIPQMMLKASNFQRIQTNLNTTNQLIHSNMTLTVAQTGVGISGSFHFDEDKNAFQVSKIDVMLKLGELRMSFGAVLEHIGDAWTDLPPVDLDVAPEFSELWQAKDETGVTLKQRYDRFLKEQINEALATP